MPCAFSFLNVGCRSNKHKEEYHNMCLAAIRKKERCLMLLVVVVVVIVDGLQKLLFSVLLMANKKIYNKFIVKRRFKPQK